MELQRISAQLYEQEQIDFLRYLDAKRALLDANLAYLAAQEQQVEVAAAEVGRIATERSVSLIFWLLLRYFCLT